MNATPNHTISEWRRGVAIERLILPPSDSDVRALARILTDTVQAGAAVSFLATLTMEGAEDWWQKTPSTSHSAAIFLVARDVKGIVGTVQLHPAWAPNQPHRAEVAKLLVHRRIRRAGVATQLMEAIENEEGAGFSLLTLDTKRGCAAEHLYRKLGWNYVGTIPRFAFDPDGTALHDDVIFYKELRGHELIQELGPKHPNEFPCSALEQTGGIVYFARMLDKIRRHAAGTLRADFHPNLGSGFDEHCRRRFHGVEYGALRQRVLAGGSDDDLLAWRSATGTHPNDEQILVWNKLMLKRGWRDEDESSSQELESYKASSGFAQRSDLLTFFDFYEVDEGRKP